jgi:superfamily II DNA or RNA helicase
MKPLLVEFDGLPHAVVHAGQDWGLEAYDLVGPPRRLRPAATAAKRMLLPHVDPYHTRPLHTPAQMLAGSPPPGESWLDVGRRSIGRFQAFWLVAEDPQARLETRDVVTLAHQISLVRHILDRPELNRVLIGDEVGLGKTVEAGMLIAELLKADPDLRILYLAPARLVSNVAAEFRRMQLGFREWKSQNGDAVLERDARIIASIHRAVHPAHASRMAATRPWDVLIVDECHHLNDSREGGGDPKRKYALVEALIARQPPTGRVILLSGTPHQGHAARFDNLLRLLRAPNEPPEAITGRVIYRTKEDVRDWKNRPLFPSRRVHAPLLVDLSPAYQSWLGAIHDHFSRPNGQAGQPTRWRGAMALQWATSSPQAGLGFLVRHALRNGWTLDRAPLKQALAALRPYRNGSPDEPLTQLFQRISAEVTRQSADADVADIEDVLDEHDSSEATLRQLIGDGIALIESDGERRWQFLWDTLLQSAGREKVVLFAQPIETVLALSAWLTKRSGRAPAVIIGGQTDEERTQQVHSFRDPAGPQHLVSSRAGGEGINLQVARRLVHLDVPWNPMEMEQRVGRVHRVGSRDTILVDTVIARNSRETRTWDVARQKLWNIAKSLVGADRFETVFSRVMCLIPPEELEAVMTQPVDPRDDQSAGRISQLVESGFQTWRSFHERFAGNQNAIRTQHPGLATWRSLGSLLRQHGIAVPHHGVVAEAFRVGARATAESNREEVEVLRLTDGSLRLAADFGSGVLYGPDADHVQPLGLNVPLVAELLQRLAFPNRPAGAAYMHWRPGPNPLRDHLGASTTILAFLRQVIFPHGGVARQDGPLTLHAFAYSDAGTRALDEERRTMLFDIERFAEFDAHAPPTNRTGKWIAEERRLADSLAHIDEREQRQQARAAVTPLLALHLH